jgi:signal transduction histidine kinase
MAEQLKRYFSISALIGTVIAVLLLSLFYREMFKSEIITIGEQNNLTIAQTALNSVKEDLIEYLETVKTVDKSNRQFSHLPPILRHAIIDAMRDANIARINIYNQNGIVVHSTSPYFNGHGESTSNNKRFVAAMNGRVASNLFYRDALNFFSSESEHDNLIETYIPIRMDNVSTVFGVFEVYTDVSPMVQHAEHNTIIVILGVSLIMLVLYFFQVSIVRRSANTITHQQQLLAERSRTLELLSAQLLNADENERKRISNELHEGLAQTLGAAKLFLEKASQIQSDSKSHNDLEPLRKTIAILQDAINEVRTMAMELRPTTLDEFGLIKTIDWLSSEFISLHSNIRLKKNIDIKEDNIPTPLKTIIYRVIKEGLANIGNQGMADDVSLTISRDNNILSLVLEDNAVAYHAANDERDTDKEIALTTIRERIILTGGHFKVQSNQQGGTIMTAEWPC